MLLSSDKVKILASLFSITGFIIAFAVGVTPFDLATSLLPPVSFSIPPAFLDRIPAQILNFLQILPYSLDLVEKSSTLKSYIH